MSGKRGYPNLSTTAIAFQIFTALLFHGYTPFCKLLIATQIAFKLIYLPLPHGDFG